MIVVHVNRNAIDRNTRESRDDPPISFHDAGEAPQDVHELRIYGPDGRLVGTLKSQAPAAPTHRDRPLVWLEIPDGCGVRPFIR